MNANTGATTSAPVASKKDNTSQEMEIDSDSSLYAGSWTQEEESYAQALMEEFRVGNIEELEDGASMRNYIAKMLHCLPKRVTKKHERTGYNGKMTYRKNVVQLTPEESKDRRDRLAGLRKSFLVSRARRRARKPYTRKTTTSAEEEEEDTVMTSLVGAPGLNLSNGLSGGLGLATPSSVCCFFPARGQNSLHPALLGGTDSCASGESYLEAAMTRARHVLPSLHNHNSLDPTSSLLNTSSIREQAGAFSSNFLFTAGSASNGGLSVADSLLLAPARNTMVLNQILQNQQAGSGLLSSAGGGLAGANPETFFLAAELRREQERKALLARMMLRQSEHEAVLAGSGLASITASSASLSGAAPSSSASLRVSAAELQLLQARQKRGLEENEEAFRQWKRARGLL